VDVALAKDTRSMAAIGEELCQALNITPRSATKYLSKIRTDASDVNWYDMGNPLNRYRIAHVLYVLGIDEDHQALLCLTDEFEDFKYPPNNRRPDRKIALETKVGKLKPKDREFIETYVDMRLDSYR